MIRLSFMIRLFIESFLFIIGIAGFVVGLFREDAVMMCEGLFILYGLQFFEIRSKSV